MFDMCYYAGSAPHMRGLGIRQGIIDINTTNDDLRQRTIVMLSYERCLVFLAGANFGANCRH